MTYPEPSSQVLGRNLWQSGNKHSKLHLVSFKLRFFEDAADERGNQMAVVEVKKKKRYIIFVLPTSQVLFTPSDPQEGGYSSRKEELTRAEEPS